MAHTNRILDLTTDDPRPVIAIDKIEYPLRTGGDLTLEQYRYLERVMPRAGALLKLDHLTATEGAEIEALLAAVTPIALDAPAAVLEKLRPLQHLMIFQTFMTLSTPNLEAATRALLTAQGVSSNGARPSPASSGSTARRRPSGSRKRH